MDPKLIRSPTSRLYAFKSYRALQIVQALPLIWFFIQRLSFYKQSELILIIVPNPGLD